MVKIIDFHGLDLTEAEVLLHTTVGRVRSRGNTEGYRLITGNGVIKQKLPGWLMPYGLTAKEELANRGVLHVEIC